MNTLDKEKSTITVAVDGDKATAKVSMVGGAHYESYKSPSGNLSIGKMDSDATIATTLTLVKTPAGWRLSCP